MTLLADPIVQSVLPPSTSSSHLISVLTRLQRRNHDQQVHQGIVDLPSAGLDDVDILTAHRVLDLAASLPDRELPEDAAAGRYSQDVADAIDQLRMGISAEDNDVADHVECSCFFGSLQTRKGVGCGQAGRGKK